MSDVIDASDFTTSMIARALEPVKRHWSLFNPSIARHPNGKLYATFRSSNYVLGEYQRYEAITVGNDIANRLFFSELDENYKPVKLIEIMTIGELAFKRGIEDARLFWRGGKWQLTAIILEKEHTRIARVGIFELDPDAGTATYIAKHDTETPKVVEKNWGVVAGESVPGFDYIYGANKIFKDEKIIKLGDVPEEIEKLRGGTQLIPFEDGYLSVGHYMVMKPKVLFNTRTFSYEPLDLRSYSHVFVKHNKDGLIEAISNKFIFHEGWVEFASGLIQDGDKFVISYGRNDLSSWVATIDVTRVISALRFVEPTSKL
jgi:hypothetical protein